MNTKMKMRMLSILHCENLKVKSISVMLIFSMMLAMFMPLFPVKVYAESDTRTQITKINLNVVSGTAVAEYGETVAHPNLEIVSTEPASAKDYLSVDSALWYKGGSWVPSGTFGEGEYYLLVSIDLSNTSQYHFDDPTDIMYINGTQLNSSAVGTNYIRNDLRYNLESPDGTAPTITTTSLEYANKGDAYSATLTATGSKPITWSLKSGSSLPSGLSLSSTGVISGTPTVSGLFDFTVVATNTAGTTEKNLSLRVKDMQQITRINLNVVSGTAVAKYGETVAHPNLEIVSTEPASAKDYLSVDSALWYKGGSWVPSGTFGEGEYYLLVSIDLSNTSQYHFDDPTDIMYINGTQLNSSAVGTNYIRNDLTCNVTSTATTHTVRFISNGGTSVTQQEVIHGETATEPSEPTRFGHSFAGWYSDSTLLTPFDFSSTPIKNNTFIYAKWNVARNVTFDLNGGTWTDAGTNPQVVNDGETAIRPTDPTKSGHVFAGWYADSACTTPFSFLTAITSNKTIYAKWNIITNSVNAILSPTPSVGLTIGDLVLTSGDSSKYSVSAGYWKLNDSGSALASTTPIEAGQTYTLYLTYYPETGYTIPDDATYTVNGIPTDWSGFEAESNRKISFTIPEQDQPITAIVVSCSGYVVGGNIAEAVPTTSSTGVTIASYEWQDNNGTKLTSGTFAADTQYRLRVFLNVADGYTANSLEKANVKINGTETTYFTNPCAGVDAQYGDMMIYHYPARLTAPQPTEYNVTVTGGTASVGAGAPITKATMGTTVTLTAGAAPTGQMFDKWVVNGVVVDDANSATTTFVMPAGNVTATATYKDIPVVTYTVTFDSAGGSAVTAQTIEAGQKATKPADPTKSGYDFKGWTLNGSAYDFNSAVNGDITLVATWEQQQVVPTVYTVTFDSNGGSAVTAQTIEAGQKATKPADPTKSGYDFKGWTLNGSAYDFNTAVNGDITLVATWETIPAGHTCDIKPVAKVEPSCTEGGKEAYYKCEGCGKFYEDALGVKEITDLANWGNLPKLGHTESDWKSDKDNHWKECTVAACGVIIENSRAAHADANNDGKCDTCEYNVGTTTTNPGNKPNDNPQTGDNSNMFLWIALLFVSGFGVVATTVIGKKKSSAK